jgi:hypothetical protein
MDRKGIGFVAAFIILLSSGINAQVLPVSWAGYYGGFDDELGYCIEQTSDGGYIVGGGTASYGEGHFEVLDAYIIKLNPEGDTIWTRTYGVRTEDDCYNIKQTPDGGYIAGIWGFIDLMKLDSNGDSLWTKSYGGLTYDMEITSDGGYILSGCGGIGGGEFYLTRTDSLGDLIWRHEYSFSPQYRVPQAVAQADDGGFIAIGYIQHPDSNYTDCYIIKVNSNGDTLWTRALNHSNPSNEEGVDVCQTADHGFLILCQNFWAVKIDSAGAEQWSGYYYGNDDRGYAYSLSTLDDGGYLLGGRGSTFSESYVMIKINGNGDIIWTNAYAEESSWGHAARPTTDGGYIMVGYSYFNGETSDIRVIKFASAEGVGEPVIMPRDIELFQNAPNPFNSSTIISYSISKSGNVKLGIYDLLGRKVTELSNDAQLAGEHQVIWEGSAVPSGVYFARLESAGYSQAIKIVLLK